MRLKLWAILMGLLFAAAACSGGDSSPAPTPTAVDTAIPSPLPTLTSTPGPTTTPIPSPTASDQTLFEESTPEVSDERPVIYALSDQDEAIPPPINITLPDGWETRHGTQLIQDIDGPRVIPFTEYRGPVSGGTGSIILVWGFPEIGLGSNPFDPDAEVTFSLYSDGLRLLRLAVVDPGCNLGTDVERTFRIGDDLAKGTVFSIVDCPAEPDTRGWFAGVHKDGLNFVFYMTGNPITVMDSDAPLEMQAILDTVEFHVTDLLLTPVPTP